MVSRLGFLGSKATLLPFSFFFCWLASADVMLELVFRMYSRAADRAISDPKSVGNRSFCMVDG
jgi:hypothetical protein